MGRFATHSYISDAVLDDMGRTTIESLHENVAQELALRQGYTPIAEQPACYRWSRVVAQTYVDDDGDETTIPECWGLRTVITVEEDTEILQEETVV